MQIINKVALAKPTPPETQIKTLKDNKRTPTRKRAPAAVGARYDLVRNFSKNKIFGLVVMGFMAVFGVLLAMQSVGPQSQAAEAYTPSTLTLKQLDTNEIEVVFADEDYPPAVVGYSISNDSRCDHDFYTDVMVGLGQIRIDGYTGGFEWSRPQEDRERPYYQGEESENWWDAWDEAEEAGETKEYRFKYPVSGIDSDSGGVQLLGKYFCLSIVYWDDNQKFKTYKKLELLHVGIPSATRTDSGTTYQFESSRNARWAEGRAVGFDSCEAEIDASSQLASSYTIEANGRDYAYKRYCVKVEDPAGDEAYISFFISGADALPEERETETQTPDPDNTGENNGADDNEDENQGGQPEQTGGEDQSNQPDLTNQLEQTRPDTNQPPPQAQNDNPNPEQSIADVPQATAPANQPEQISEADTNQPPPQAQNDNPNQNLNQNQQETTNQEESEEEVVTILTADNAETDSVTQVPIAQALPEKTDTLPDTGFLDDQNWFQILGYTLVAAAVLGTTRIMIMKKSKTSAR